MKRPVIADIEYGPNEVEQIRNAVIELRDEATKQAAFDWSVTLSHTIGLLGALKTELAKQET